MENYVNSIAGIGSTREEILRKMVFQINLLALEDETPGKCVLVPVVNDMCPYYGTTTVRIFLLRLAAGILRPH